MGNATAGRPDRPAACYLGSMMADHFRVRRGPADLACLRFGSGPPLLCLHALAFSKEYFGMAAEVLGPRFDCVAFDQRGHGETRVEGALDATAPRDLAGDIEAVLDHVGWPRATLAGTSLGAAAALLFAHHRPDRVAMLLQDLPAFGPSSTRDPLKTDAMVSALDRSDLGLAAREAGRGLPSGRARALADALLAQWRPFPPEELGPKLAAVFRVTARWRIFDRWPDELGEVSMPTHILALAGDLVHPLSVAEEMARAMPRGRLWPRVPSLDAAVVTRQWAEVLSAPWDG